MLNCDSISIFKQLGQNNAQAAYASTFSANDIRRHFSYTFYHFSSYATTVFSCIGNSYLIYAILVTNVSHIGPYRWLLFSFAVVDVCISIVHATVIPFCHLSEFGYIFWGDRFIHDSTSAGLWSDMCWVFLYYQTFILLGFHYIYRFVVVCSPSWLSWMQSNKWRNWMIIAIVADLLFTGTLCCLTKTFFSPTNASRRAFAPVLREVYGIDLFSANRPGYIAAIYWELDANGQKVWMTNAVTAILLIMALFFSSGVIIIFCLIRITLEMRVTDFNMSSKLRTMQRQLFKALLWQTLVPTCTSYLPLGAFFVAPLLLSFPLGGLGTVAAMCAQLFPMADPMLVFFFVQAYRSALPSFIRQVVEVKQAVVAKPTIAPSAMTV